MRRGTVLLCLILLWIAPGLALAQDDDDLSPEAIEEAAAGGANTGLSWGYTRTYWGQSATDEGYARAGTAGPTIELRTRRPMGGRTALSLYARYFWMYSTVSYLVCDTCAGQTVRERSYFREIDLGANLEFGAPPSGEGWYFGGGPLVRFGNSGHRIMGGDRPGQQRKAAWFGLAVLAGYRTDFGGRTMTFFEPQFIFSPDPADRWQEAYPPNNLVLQMGVLF